MDKKNRVVIISGCGFKVSEYNKLSNRINIFNDPAFKVNIGTSTALALAEVNCDLILISKTEEKLRRIRQSIHGIFPKTNIEINAFDLLNESHVKEFASTLDVSKEYHYVHCAGISSGSFMLKDDNPYLPVEETPNDLPTIEFEAVVKSLLLMIKNLLPFFKEQSESRVVVVSSMSSIRSVPFGFSHTSAKAGLHNATRSLSLELNKLNIFISEIMPGAVDTGMYDNEIVKKRIIEMGKLFGYDYDAIPMMPPSAVADAVQLCLNSKSHILSINMVAQGQWPNLGS